MKPVEHNPRSIPTATYRLQLNKEFTFDDARRIVPYLQQLGISHVYASPCLRARAGSLHGYDIVDHNNLNPEIGDQNNFAHYVDSLHTHGMGLILDLVPNHMAVGGNDNTWWLDVLENGPSSVYADYFDILWNPVKTELQGKALLPFLGDHYGTVLENGELQLDYDADNGAFAVHYYEHKFPIDPRTYATILIHAVAPEQPSSLLEEETRHQLQTLVDKLSSLPHRNDVASREQRQDQIVHCKSELVMLYKTHRDLPGAMETTLQYFNGTPEHPESFESLHRLLEEQAYRLAYWQVASDEINYRRFFDINDLAGLRVENTDVFFATHQLVLDLIASGHINGLRIDHPDGLYDPASYYEQLRKSIKAIVPTPNSDPDDSAPTYIVAEKILASYEHLPPDWPIQGTTGYEVAALLNGLFVNPDAEKRLNNIYMRFTSRQKDFDAMVYERKKLVISKQLSSELAVLTTLLDAIAETDRHTRDFTYQGLRDALTEVVACFPVYRTYVTHDGAGEADQRYIDWAIALAKKHSTATDVLIFDFIRDILLLEYPAPADSKLYARMVRFTGRFQQYTAPVMAKGMEDTALYVYNRLISLNDVGFDPRSFGISVNAFHHMNQQRLQHWSYTMVNTSTHDSKRGEDVRARINVLTELPAEWRQHLGRWGQINRQKKRLIDNERAPSRNDEYLLYQTLSGTCPLEGLNVNNIEVYRERIEAYMLKAIKEAKVNTSWINPNQEYEDAMRHFVRSLLDDPERNAFLTDFLSFQQQVARFGLMNGLSHTLLKLSIPGVPDIYQGNDLWAFNLVDPDNRRPVDYELRQSQLQSLTDYCDTNNNLAPLTRQLLENIHDGRAKLYVTWKTLNFRRERPDLFNDADYTGLIIEGEREDNICAFARHTENAIAIIVTARWYSQLCSDENPLPVGGSVWQNTHIDIGALADIQNNNNQYFNYLTGETITASKRGNKHYLNAADLFAAFPVALLVSS